MSVGNTLYAAKSAIPVTWNLPMFVMNTAIVSSTSSSRHLKRLWGPGVDNVIQRRAFPKYK